MLNTLLERFRVIFITIGRRYKDLQRYLEMCGRTACTLNPQQISKHTRYQNSKGSKVEPKWRPGDTGKYRQSYNKAPQSFCPVLLHASHMRNKDGDDSDHERYIASMKWGLVPSWVKDLSQAQYKMNNARSDTMLAKTSYKRPLENGQRCVMIADGFYEWNTTKTEKQPYYIYMRDSIMNDDKTMAQVDKDETTEKSLIMMAGIFERRDSPDDDDSDELFTFSVITVDAHPSFAWLHHRMPAILENEDEVAQWLDSRNVPLEKAIQLIKPKDCLDWHPVSKVVNYSKNNSPECIVKIDLEKEKAKLVKPETKQMAKWLTRSLAKVSTENNNSIIDKRFTVKKESTNTPPKKPTTPEKRTKKRSGSANLMQGWLKKAKSE